MERPSLEPIAFALTVSATVDHRPAGVPQVSVEPLLPQHRDECGQKGDQKTRKQETGSDDDLAGRVLLDGRNGGGFVWDCGVIEGEKDGLEESCRSIVGIWLKLFIDVDDKS